MKEPQPPAVDEIDPSHELPAAEAAGGEGAASESDEIKRLRAERDQFNDRWLRTAAELDNFRKRAQREVSEQRLQAAAEIVRAVVPVLDGLDRALQHAGAEGPELRKGVEMVRKQMLDGLRRVGVEPLETAGVVFDPHLHEAVEMVETDGAADSAIVEELQRGYMLRDRLIRPAMVKVARSTQR